MEKIVTIEERKIKLNVNGQTPSLFEKQFGKDLISEMDNMGQKGLNLTLFNDFLWIAAKQGDTTIAPPDEFNASFESYPILSVIEEVKELFESLMGTKKKPKGKVAVKSLTPPHI